MILVLFFMKQIFFGKNDYAVKVNICSWLIFNVSEIRNTI